MNSPLPTPDPDDPEEIFRWEERAAILTDGSPRELTEDEIRMCREDVLDFRARRTD